MQHFTLDSRLENDTLPIGQLQLCHVRLMDDARYPWLIIVPNRAHITEIIDLSDSEQMQLMREISAASNTLKTLFSPDKLNIAALGNHIAQLHVHIIARFVSDEAWPHPVWGKGEPQPYPPHMAGSLVDRIANALKITSEAL